MGAEFVTIRDDDADEMHRAGVVVRMEVDDEGIPVVHVSTAPGTFVAVVYNRVIVGGFGPSDDERAALSFARAEEEATRSVEDRLKAAIEARVGATDDVAAVARIAAEESVKLRDSTGVDQVVEVDSVVVGDRIAR